jgi:nickel-dependent lactate racemase
LVLPGISDATLIVTLPDALFALATEIAVQNTASRLATMTAAVVAIRVDFIVTSLSSTNREILRFCAGRVARKRVLLRLAEPDSGVLR